MKLAVNILQNLKLKWCFLVLVMLFAVDATAQCPDGQPLLGQELVVNGHFSDGNKGFTSEYTYSEADLLLEAYYSVTDDAANVHNEFTGKDHTTGDGNFMVINGAAKPNTSVWCQMVKVKPNTTYIFSTWITSVFYWGPAVLQFSINGKNLDTTFNAPNEVGKWQQFYTTWFSGTDTVAQICIVNQNTEVFGNDFALDDISFIACGCGTNAFAGKDTSICKGQSMQLNGTGGKIYKWLPATNLSNDTIANPIATPTVTTTYKLVAKNGSCEDTAQITITVSNPFSVNVNQPDTICEGESVQLLASGGVKYLWSPSTGLSATNIANPVAKPQKTTTYTVIASNGGCFDTEKVTVHIIPSAKIPPLKIKICQGESRTLNVSGGLKYRWFPSAGLSSDTVPNPVASPPISIVYKAVIYKQKCTDTVVFDITVNELPVVRIMADSAVCPYDIIEISATGAEQYVWNNGYTGQKFTTEILKNETFIVTGISNGCTAKDTFTVYATAYLADTSCLWVPNSFTPNEDNINENFAYVACNITEIELLIYNRWGEELYRTNKLNDFWDGKFKGQLVPEGVYVYLVIATGEDRKKYHLNGTVTVLR